MSRMSFVTQAHSAILPQKNRDRSCELPQPPESRHLSHAEGLRMASVIVHCDYSTTFPATSFVNHRLYPQRRWKSCTASRNRWLAAGGASPCHLCRHCNCKYSPAIRSARLARFRVRTSCHNACPIICRHTIRASSLQCPCWSGHNADVSARFGISMIDVILCSSAGTPMPNTVLERAPQAFTKADRRRGMPILNGIPCRPPTSRA